MIISVNSKPDLSEFKKLMLKTDQVLNDDAQRRPGYYATRGGNPLEDDVKAALEECAIGTPFENTIEKISGQRFPDIIAAKFYGVEVKSTKENHWTSTGSSILETTRVSDVERIYMTFGKLGGKPIEFLSKPYEECLYGIAVTHMPRYLINMKLSKGETIFDKIGITYDELRQLENPIAPVSKYYRSQLKPGERLWWAGDAADETVSATIRLWKNVPTEEKRRLTVYGCVNYPEVFGGNYDRYALWLTSQGVVDPHIRDQFSAGGQEEMRLSSGEKIKFPGVYRRVKNNIDLFLKVMADKDTPVLLERCPSRKSELGKRLLAWSSAVSKVASIKYEISMDALTTLFFEQSDVMYSKPLRHNGKRVTCCNCGRIYEQVIVPQEEGFKEMDDDICPYCKKSNGSSMEKEYMNYKI